jgi:hypothetical protein
VGVAGPVVSPRLFDVALHLPAIRAGLLITSFARLLRGSSGRTGVATLVAPSHAIRLCGGWRDASEHHDGSQDTNASPKLLLWSHAVPPLVQRFILEICSEAF